MNATRLSDRGQTGELAPADPETANPKADG